jgi:hypothetical protein
VGCSLVPLEEILVLRPDERFVCGITFGVHREGKKIYFKDIIGSQSRV